MSVSGANCDFVMILLQAEVVHSRRGVSMQVARHQPRHDKQARQAFNQQQPLSKTKHTTHTTIVQ